MAKWKLRCYGIPCSVLQQYCSSVVLEVKTTAPYIRPKRAVGIDTDKCGFEIFTMQQGTFSCIESNQIYLREA